MAFKLVRTFAMPAIYDSMIGGVLVQIGLTRSEPPSYFKYEQEMMKKIGATLEAASFAPGTCTEEELLSLIRNADAVITLREPFTRYVIERLERCRIINIIGVGYDPIDVKAATDCGVCVANNPEYCLEEVSDQAMALLLTLARKIKAVDKTLHSAKTSYTDIAQARGRVFRLREQTLGLVGLGRIPRTLVPKARGFGLKIIAYDPYVPAEVAKGVGVELVDLERLLKESDFVSVHAALTAENKGMFGLEQFKKMKPTAFFINTARGGLVQTDALCTALSEGIIAGAGLDVTETEPLDPDDPLLKFENAILTGHSGSYSETSLALQWKEPLDEITRVLTGEWPRFLVNPAVKEKFTRRWGHR